MDYYALAEDDMKTINVLINAGQYRTSITHSCMAIEYLLKSKLVLLLPDSEYLYGHDIIKIFKKVQEKYQSAKDLSTVVRFCRKYLNESRYPMNGMDAYTKDFAEQFKFYVEEIKDYVDNECSATIDDLKDKFKPRKA